MERPHTKHMLVLITNPFAMLNVLHSGFLRELGWHYSISVMSDLLTSADVAHLNAHFRINMRLLECDIPRVSRPLKWLRTFQTALFGYFFQLETFRIKLAERHPVLERLFQITRNTPAFRAWTGWLLIRIRKWLMNRRLAARHWRSPCGKRFAVVISTSPLDLRENLITNALTRDGTRCVSMIISWDNLTSKGVINAAPDLVLVWDKRMAEEYERFYTLFGNVGQVCVTGILRFGIYSIPPHPAQVRAFRAGLGTPPNAFVILFSTGAVKHHVCQQYMIEDLLEYARGRPEVVIWVRCHPGDDPGRYEHYIGHENVRILPACGCSATQVPPADFLETLQMQLSASQVCIQVASTMLLDAIACDKPVISIGYDAHPEMPFRKSVRRFYDYSHHLSLHAVLKENIVYDRMALLATLDELSATKWLAPAWQSDLRSSFNINEQDPARKAAQYIQEWLEY